MELKDLYGEHLLTGVSFGELVGDPYDNGDVCSTVDFILDGKVYSTIENPSVGYRSSMKEIVDGRICEIQNVFPPLAVIGVEMPCNYKGQHEGLDFIDKVTGKIVLSIGTEDTDDYYPSFVSRFNPENMAHNAVT